MKKLPERPIVSENTTDWGVGPVGLNVDMARRHGWTEKQINRAAEELRRISRKEGGIAQRRHPDWYTREADGTVVFVKDLAS